MPKITDKKLIRRIVTLFEEDYQFLRAMHKEDIGVNAVIRTLVHTYVNNIKTNADVVINEAEMLKDADETKRLEEVLEAHGASSIADLIIKEGLKPEG